jgi:hypothetical protein
MKKDVNDLFNAVKEAGNKQLQVIGIDSAYERVRRYKEYTKAIKNRY